MDQRGEARSERHIIELDGLRGVAVAMVVLLHLIIQNDWGNLELSRWLHKLLGVCDQGVDVFFVLSGFLIGSILIRHRDSPRLLKAFYARRFFRIVPIYYLLLASLWILTPIDNYLRFGLIYYLHDPNPLPHLRYLLFFQNSVIASTQSMEPHWLAVTWSLAVEEQFYLVSPLVTKFLRRNLAIGLCVGALLVCPFLRFVYVGKMQNVYAILLLVCRADALCAGFLVAWACSSEKALDWFKTRSRWVALAVWLYVVSALLDAFLRGNASLTGIVLRPSFYAFGNAIIVLCLMTRENSIFARILRIRPLVALGGISYFVYLFHWPLKYVAETQLPNHRVLAVAISVPVTIGLAILSRRRFEQPLLRYAKRFSY